MAQQHINYGTPNDGTGDTLRTSQVKAESNFNELYTNKVDKIVGKQLSDENFTLAEKTKLAGLVEGGQVNADWNEGDSGNPAFIENKPENVSDFFNDSQYVVDTEEVLPQVRSAGVWLPLSDMQLQPVFFPILTSVQQDFELPAGKTAVFGFINQAIQLPANAANATKNYTFTQTDNIVTLKTATIAGNLITLFVQ